MKTKLNIEFPCGYKYNLEFLTGILDTGFNEINNELPDKCPLHGKNCPPSREVITEIIPIGN